MRTWRAPNGRVVVLDWITGATIERESIHGGYYRQVYVLPALGDRIQVASYWGPSARTFTDENDPDGEHYRRTSAAAEEQAAATLAEVEALLATVPGPRHPDATPESPRGDPELADAARAFHAYLMGQYPERAEDQFGDVLAESFLVRMRLRARLGRYYPDEFPTDPYPEEPSMTEPADDLPTAPPPDPPDVPPRLAGPVGALAVCDTCGTCWWVTPLYAAKWIDAPHADHRHDGCTAGRGAGRWTMAPEGDTDLFGRFDARWWAARFAARARRSPSLATDEGAMLAWFAGAIMAGYDRGHDQGEQGGERGAFPEGVTMGDMLDVLGEGLPDEQRP